MTPDIPPAPPEADLIRVAREALGLTAEDAARRSREVDPARRGVSAVYWRDIEKGRGGRRGQRVPARASARSLAVMARTVEVVPAQLTHADREDAARVLAEMSRRAGGEPGSGILERAPDRIAEALAPYVRQMTTRITMAAAAHADARDLEPEWVLPDRPDRWWQWRAFVSTGHERFPPGGWSRQEMAEGFALLLLLADTREREEGLAG